MLTEQSVRFGGVRSRRDALIEQRASLVPALQPHQSGRHLQGHIGLRGLQHQRALEGGERVIETPGTQQRTTECGVQTGVVAFDRDGSAE